MEDSEPVTHNPNPNPNLNPTSQLQRMEESFAFAVECMQNDMSQAREQLRQLRLTSSY